MSETAPIAEGEIEPRPFTIDQTEYAFLEGEDGKVEKVEFEKEVNCLLIYEDEQYSINSIIEAAEQAGAVYKNRYIIEIEDGAPFLMTREELEDFIKLNNSQP